MATKTSYIHHQISNLPGNPTKNDHFGVFWGYHHLRKHHIFPQVFLLPRDPKIGTDVPEVTPPKKKTSFPDKTNPWDERPRYMYRNI